MSPSISADATDPSPTVACVHSTNNDTAETAAMDLRPIAESNNPPARPASCPTEASHTDAISKTSAAVSRAPSPVQRDFAAALPTDGRVNDDAPALSTPADQITPTLQSSSDVSSASDATDMEDDPCPPPGHSSHGQGLVSSSAGSAVAPRMLSLGVQTPIIVIKRG